MTRDEVMNMSVGREMDVTVGYHVMDLHAPPEIYPDYSTDIAAAWEVVNKSSSFMVTMQDEDLGYTKWYCEYATETGYFEAEADTAPLAICRAALLAVMENTEV
jgi:hypothetical protein